MTYIVMWSESLEADAWSIRFIKTQSREAARTIQKRLLRQGNVVDPEIVEDK